MESKSVSKLFAALFLIGSALSVYFRYAFVHAIRIWRHFELSVHGFTPLFFENDVERALRWLIIAVSYTFVTGVA